MNKILIEDLPSKDLHLKDDTIIVIDSQNKELNIHAKESIKVFILGLFSNININYYTSKTTTLNIFTVDTSLDININLEQDNINLSYNYSTINVKDNNYKIDINHLKNNITSKITNHGINTDNNKLSFIINTIVPKDTFNIKTSQDSKIIVLKDNNATIKPNLLIDTEDIEADHAAYIGKFKENEIFYLMTRGLPREIATDLLVKSFLISDMNISYKERDLILNNIKKYWR